MRLVYEVTNHDPAHGADATPSQEGTGGRVGCCSTYWPRTYGGGPGVVTPFLVEHFTAAHFVRRRRTRCSSCSREDCACSVVLGFLRSCRSRSQRPPTYPSPMCSDTHVLAWRAKRQLDGAAELELSCFRARAPVLGQLVDPTYREHPRRTHTLIVELSRNPDGTEFMISVVLLSHCALALHCEAPVFSMYTAPAPD